MSSGCSRLAKKLRLNPTGASAIGLAIPSIQALDTNLRQCVEAAHPIVLFSGTRPHAKYDGTIMIRIFQRLFCMIMTLAAIGCTKMEGTDNQRPHTSSITYGQGGVNVVLVHGIAASKETWASVAAILSKVESLKIHQIDLLGHGSRSQSDSGVITLEDQSDFLEKYLSENNLETAIVVGHSYGGLVALMTQLRYPSGSRELILINAPIFGGNYPLFVEYFRSPVLSALTNALTTPESRARMGLSKLYVDRNKITEDTIQRYAALLRNPETYYGIKRSAKGIRPNELEKYIDLFPQMIGKLGFIRSSGDTVTTPDVIEKAIATFQAVETEIIYGCGHNVHEECPEETALAVLALIGRD